MAWYWLRYCGLRPALASCSAPRPHLRIHNGTAQVGRQQLLHMVAGDAKEPGAGAGGRGHWRRVGGWVGGGAEA